MFKRHFFSSSFSSWSPTWSVVVANAKEDTKASKENVASSDTKETNVVRLKDIKNRRYSMKTLLQTFKKTALSFKNIR